MYIFIGRYPKTLLVDLVTFNDKDTALAHYERMLYSMNELGYSEIELLEQTALNFYTVIEKN